MPRDSSLGRVPRRCQPVPLAAAAAAMPASLSAFAMVVGPVRPKPAHQASAEYKLRLFLGLSDLYYDAGYSAGSETERVALKKRPETQNRSHSNLDHQTRFCTHPTPTQHLQHPRTPPRAARLNRARAGVRPLQQGPSRQAAPAAQQRLRQQAAPARQAARRQPAGRSGRPFRTLTAAGRRQEGPQGRGRPGR